MEISKVEAMSPLTWAYVGDSIYEAFIRTHLVETTNLKPHKLHIQAIKYVKAKAQADILKRKTSLKKIRRTGISLINLKRIRLKKNHCELFTIFSNICFSF